MMYYLAYKEKGTEHKYVWQYKTPLAIEAVKTAVRVAQQLQDEYNERFNNEFDVNWREARKEKFYKDNAWAVRVKDDNNKTIVFLNSDMLRG